MSEPLDSGGEETLPKSGDGQEARTGEIRRLVENSITRVPALEIKFEGRAISPDKIFMPDLAEVIRAVQRLVIGPRPDDALRLDQEDKLRLVRVLRGSAIYRLAGPSPAMAGAHLRILNEVIERPEQIGENDYILKPVDTLSNAAAKLGCRILLREPGRGGKVLARIGPETYDHLAKSVLVSGQTEFCGEVIRVGNATHSKCALRVAFQKRMLYCRVPNLLVARSIGENLYKRVIASGEANWIRTTWRVFSFQIDAVRPLEEGSLIEKIKAIRDAGGFGWDRVTNIQAYLDGEEVPEDLDAIPDNDNGRRRRMVEPD